jgi:hypothetical protein
MRGTPEITSAACVVELKNASSKMAAKLIDALGQSIREPKSRRFRSVAAKAIVRLLLIG